MLVEESGNSVNLPKLPLRTACSRQIALGGVWVFSSPACSEVGPAVTPRVIREKSIGEESNCRND